MSRAQTALRLAALGLLAASPLLVWGLRHLAGLASVCALAFAGALAVPVLLRRQKIPLDGPRELAFLSPFVACWGLGEGARLFERISWWDDLAHLCGGVAVAAVLLAILEAKLQVPFALAAPLVVLAGLGVGGLWELVEFGCDQLLGAHTQSGLQETMLDLLFDLGGAALGAALFHPAARPVHGHPPLRSPLRG